MPNVEETHAIRRVLAGDENAFETIYRQHFPRVYATVAQRVRDRDDVEDLVQLAFVRAFHGLARFRGDAALGTWLTRIAMNVCASYYESRYVRARYMEALSAQAETVWLGRCETPEEAFCRRECRERVRREIAALPGVCREAMHLRYVEDRSYTEIGETLRVPVGTVKTWLWRGRKLLSDPLGESETRAM